MPKVLMDWGYQCPMHKEKKTELTYENLAILRERIRQIEKRLDNAKIPEASRRQTEVDICDLKEVLETNEQMLLKLQRKKSMAFIIVSNFVLAALAVYGFMVLEGRA